MAVPYEQRDNSGSLFNNDRKNTEKHPDDTGTAMVGGVEYYISAWRKRSSGGKDFISLSFTPKNQAGNRSGGGGGARQEQRAPAPARKEETLDQDIPF